MEKYEFNVNLTETYETTINIEAHSLEEAKVLLRQELEENPIDQRKNTYGGQELEIFLERKGDVPLYIDDITYI